MKQGNNIEPWEAPSTKETDLTLSGGALALIPHHDVAIGGGNPYLSHHGTPPQDAKNRHTSVTQREPNEVSLSS